MGNNVVYSLVYDMELGNVPAVMRFDDKKSIWIGERH